MSWELFKKRGGRKEVKDEDNDHIFGLKRVDSEMFRGEPRRYEINVLLDFIKTGRGYNGMRVKNIISVKGE